MTYFLTGLFDEVILPPPHLGEQKEVHSQSIGKFAHHRPQARKSEDGYESKGKLQKKKIRSDRATGVPVIP